MTPIQRRILWLMRELGETYVACTGENSRKDGFGHWIAEEGGLVIRAYSDPLYFMKGRNGPDRPKPWLEPVERNARGRWYKITEEGLKAASTIRDEPPEPRANPRSDFGAKKRFNW